MIQTTAGAWTKRERQVPSAQSCHHDSRPSPSLRSQFHSRSPPFCSTLPRRHEALAPSPELAPQAQERVPPYHSEEPAQEQASSLAAERRLPSALGTEL
jgi:hypothetical protein